MKEPLFNWIQTAMEGKAIQKNMVVVESDYNGKGTQLSLTHAVITAVTFPEVNAASKDVATMTLEVQPAVVRVVAATGTIAKAPPSKAWLASSYRVEMDNVTLPGVSRMSGVGMRMNFSQDPVGEFREPTKTAAQMSISDFSLTVATSQTSGLTAWANDLLVKGIDKERTFRVTYLAPDMKSALFEVTLKGVGIFGGDIFLPASQDSEQIARSTYHLYAEEISIAPRSGGVVK